LGAIVRGLLAWGAALFALALNISAHGAEGAVRTSQQLRWTRVCRGSAWIAKFSSSGGMVWAVIAFHPALSLGKRQTIDLGGKVEQVESDLNQFAKNQTENRLVLTAGKFAVGDVFGQNKYAAGCPQRFHEPGGRFHRDV
jgi:hypothetical protein